MEYQSDSTEDLRSKFGQDKSIRRLVINQSIVKNFIDMIPSQTEEFRFELGDDKLVFQGFTKQILKDNLYLKQPMLLTISLNVEETMGDLEGVNVRYEMKLRFLRIFINLAEKDEVVEVYFEEDGDGISFVNRRGDVEIKFECALRAAPRTLNTLGVTLRSVNTLRDEVTMGRLTESRGVSESERGANSVSRISESRRGESREESRGEMNRYSRTDTMNTPIRGFGTASRDSLRGISNRDSSDIIDRLDWIDSIDKDLNNRFNASDDEYNPTQTNPVTSIFHGLK